MSKSTLHPTDPLARYQAERNMVNRSLNPFTQDATPRWNL